MQQQPPSPQPKQIPLTVVEVQRRARILACSRLLGDEAALATFGLTQQGLQRIQQDVSEGRDLATERAAAELESQGLDDFRPLISTAYRKCLEAAIEMAEQRFPSLDAAKACFGMITALKGAWADKKAFDELVTPDGAGSTAPDPQAQARRGGASPRVKRPEH